jgi:hypothetical protein
LYIFEVLTGKKNNPMKMPLLIPVYREEKPLRYAYKKGHKVNGIRLPIPRFNGTGKEK